MNPRTPIVSALAAVFLALGELPSAAQCPTTFSETFTGGSNTGRWTFGNSYDAIRISGGNPGAYLANWNLDTYAPQPRTGPVSESISLGAYRGLGVTSLGIDLQTFDLDFPTTCQRPLSLLLENDNGTPGNTSDDCIVYIVTNLQVPCVDGVWHSYDVPVPAASATMPAGWQVDPNCTLTPDQAWNKVIQAVTRVRWFYGDPTNFFIFAMWDVGMDNPRITFAEGPQAYCAGKTNSQGCTPSISWGGFPSASSPFPFFLGATGVINNKPGILIYGFAPHTAPFQGGTLCIGQPIQRTPVQLSGGNPPPDDCSGRFALDFNARIQSGVDPQLVPGAKVHAQYWYRDGGAASGTGLTDAAVFEICP